MLYLQSILMIKLNDARGSAHGMVTRFHVVAETPCEWSAKIENKGDSIVAYSIHIMNVNLSSLIKLISYVTYAYAS